MKELKKMNVEQSFSRPGTPHDNAVCESFFNTLKQEELHRWNYHSEKEMKRQVNEYIMFYNEERRHAYLQYQTPSRFEALYYEKLKNGMK